MANDNETLQAVTSGLQVGTGIALIKAEFSGDADQAIGLGLEVDAVTGAEGSRVAFVYRKPVDSGEGAQVDAGATGTLQTVPNIATDLVFRLDGIQLQNQGAAVATVGVTNGAGQYIVPPAPLAAGGVLVLTFGDKGKPTTGAKWRANSVSVTGQVWGRSAL